MPTSENRTKWPVQGGAVSFQPGWFQGHSRAQIYINIGLGTVPPNMSHPMITPFEIVGPDNDPYPGTICLPQVKLPAGIEVQVGDNATIQVIELAQHGAALYNVSHARSFSLVLATRSNAAFSARTSPSPNPRMSPKSTPQTASIRHISPSRQFSQLPP